MTYLLLQTFLLLLSAYFLGAFLACLAMRFFKARSLAYPVDVVAAEPNSVPLSTPVSVPAPVPAPVVAAEPRAPLAPIPARGFERVQPKIEVIARPAPVEVAVSADDTRFDRALLGALVMKDGGYPRTSIVEIRPQALKSPTSVAPGSAPVKAAPPAPKASPPPAPPASPQPAIQPPPPTQTSAAAAAAAAAVAAAKAAAAASAKPASAPSAATPPQPAVTPLRPAADPPRPAPAPPAPPAKPLVAVNAPPKADPAPTPAQPAPTPAQPAPSTAQSTPPPAKAATVAPPLEAAPAPRQPATPAPSTVGDADDFLRIRAVDEETQRRLKALGVTRFEEMARWTPADINRINQGLGLNGRIEREQWVEQAQILAKGGETYYSRNRAAAAAAARAGAVVPPPAKVGPSVTPAAPPAPPPQPPATAPSPPKAAASPPPPQAPVPPPPQAPPAQSAPPPSSAPPNAPVTQPLSTPVAAATAAAAAAALTRSPAPASPPPQKLPADPPATPPSAPQPSSPPAGGTLRPVAASAAAPQGATASPQGASAAAEANRPQRSVSEMANLAAAAIAAASASVTRGMRPIEPISPLSKVDPNILRPARIQDAIKEQEAKAATATDAASSPAQLPGELNQLRSVKSETLRSPATDDLKRIRGIGVLIEKRLNAAGVTRYDQIANWTVGDIDRISQNLDFKGRIERENWVEQARILSSGGQTEFSRRVDRGEVDSSRES